jgi:hypothetical protein
VSRRAPARGCPPRVVRAASTLSTRTACGGGCVRRCARWGQPTPVHAPQNPALTRLVRRAQRPVFAQAGAQRAISASPRRGESIPPPPARPVRWRGQPARPARRTRPSQSRHPCRPLRRQTCAMPGRHSAPQAARGAGNGSAPTAHQAGRVLATAAAAVASFEPPRTTPTPGCLRGARPGGAGLPFGCSVGAPGRGWCCRAADRCRSGWCPGGVNF